MYLWYAIQGLSELFWRSSIRLRHRLSRVPMTRSSKLSPNMAGAGKPLEFGQPKPEITLAGASTLRFASHSPLLSLGLSESREGEADSLSLPHRPEQPHNPGKLKGRLCSLGRFSASSCFRRPLGCQWSGGAETAFSLGEGIRSGTRGGGRHCGERKKRQPKQLFYPEPRSLLFFLSFFLPPPPLAASRTRWFPHVAFSRAEIDGEWGIST